MDNVCSRIGRVGRVFRGVRGNRLCLPGSERLTGFRVGYLSELCSFGRAQPARVTGQERLLGRVFTRVNRKYCVRPPFRTGFNKHRIRFNGRICTGFGLATISSARVCINSRAVVKPGIALTSTKRPILPRLHRGKYRFGVPVRVNGGY